MFYSCLDNICNIVYYFYPLYTIPIDTFTNDLDNNRKCLQNPYKYFTWRKYSLILLLPLIFLDIIFNILNYKQLKETLINNKTNRVFLTNDIKGINDYNNIIEFLNTRTVNDYIILYSIIPLIFILFESVFILISLYYKDTWLKSKKYFIYSSYLSILWIYIVFLLPLTKLLEFENSNFLLNAYVYIYIIINILKEIIPIIYNLFLGIIWTSLNFKILFPDNLYLGQIYSVITNIYFFSVGFILLIFIQITRNYLITFFILFNLLSIFIPKILYAKHLKYIYLEDDDELIERINKMRFIYNLCLGIGLILLFSYTLLDNNIINGIFSINRIFIIQFIIKFLYRNIYFKILMGDIILSKLLFIEKQKGIYKPNVKDHNELMNKIDRELYIETRSINSI